MHRLLLSLFVLIQYIILPGAPFAAGTPAEAVSAQTITIEHVRIMWLKNPQEEAVVSWTTRTPGTDHRVYYDTESHGRNIRAYDHSAGTFKDGKYTLVNEDSEWSEPGWYHHVHLDNLQPATTYYLRISSDDQVSQEYHFITAPEDDVPFSLIYGGDSRIGRESGPSGGMDPYEHTDRRNIFRRVAELVKQYPDIIALSHSGDFCLNAEWRYMERWLSDYELTTTGTGRLMPIIPGRGNHDRQVGFEEMFPWPDFHRNYYFTTQLSGETALISLNTNISIIGDQKDWLKVQLQELRPANRWVFVQYHVPAYGSVKSIAQGAPQRQHWVPLFEEYDVNLVGESDHHTLKRTVPIRYGAPDMENGITYIGDGGLGVPQRVPDTTRWWFQDPGFAISAHHVQLLEFGQEELRVRAIGIDGKVLDDFSVTPNLVPAE